MQEALYRALPLVPPASLDELRPRTGAVALLCTVAGCTQCARFEAEGRDAFEAREFRGVPVRPWDCTDTHRRDLVMHAGVDEVPAYVRLDANPRVPPSVLRPPA